MPGIASRSSTARNGPCAWRQSRIFCAVTGPIPGSASSCSSVALARLTFAPAAAAPPAPPAAAPAGRSASRHDDLLAVGDGGRQVDEREVGVSVRPSGTLEGVGDPSSLRQPDEPGAPHGADDVDDEPGREAPARRSLP